MNPVFHPADLSPEGREAAAGGVDNGAAIIEAALDRGGDAGELSDVRAKPTQPRKLTGGDREPLTEIADGAKGLDRLGERFGFENPADVSPPHVLANVVQTTEGGSQPGGECFGHLGRQCLAAVNLARLAARLEAEGRGLAERAGGAGRDERADLVEIEQLERVRIHVAPRRGEAAAEAGAGRSLLPQRPILDKPVATKVRGSDSDYRTARASQAIASSLPRRPRRKSITLVRSRRGRVYFEAVAALAAGLFVVASACGSAAGFVSARSGWSSRLQTTGSIP